MARWHLLWIGSCRFFQSACGHRNLPGDGPNEARQFPGDRSGDNIGWLPGSGEPAIAGAQPHLSLPGDVADRLGLVLLAQQQLATDPCREAVTPGGLDQQPASGAVAGLSDAPAFDAGTTRVLGRNQ